MPRYQYLVPIQLCHLLYKLMQVTSPLWAWEYPSQKPLPAAVVKIKREVLLSLIRTPLELVNH